MARANQRRGYKRTDRINETLREIVATELERLGDERTELVTITDVVTAGDLGTATVYYSALSAENATSDDVVESLEAVRWRIQKVVNGALSTRRVPQITFAADDVLESALRIEQLLRDVATNTGGSADEGSDTDSSGESDPGPADPTDDD